MKKLRHALYAVLNTSDVDSSDFRIANYLIENINKIESFSIQEVADACYVSKSSVSRFCRRIGYADYQAMSQSIHHVRMQTYRRFDEYHDLPVSQMTDGYFAHLADCIEQVRAYATDEILSDLAQTLDRFENIGIFGQLQSYAVAMNLQFELASLNKHVSSFIMLNQQEEFIHEAGPESMVIVISSSGQYFQDLAHYFDYRSKKRPYLILITNNQRLKKGASYDKVYVVPSANNAASQPISLQLFTNLVVMYYNRLLTERGAEHGKSTL